MYLIRTTYQIIKMSTRAMSTGSGNKPHLNFSKLTSNIHLMSEEKPSGDALKSTRPLVVLMSWMMGKQRHLSRYAEIYTDKGCDVLTVNISPWQLLWPTSGAQVVARELVDILEKTRTPLFVHGFSVGAYVWAEALLQLGAGHPVLKRISGQIWDSAADFSAMAHGLPYAIFPTNILARTMLQSYIKLHTKVFYYSSIVHYEKARNYFFNGGLPCPGLLFCSENDLIGTAHMNQKCREGWERAGMDVYWKCWKKSAHVSHMTHHTEEYMEELEKFLKHVNFPPPPKAHL